MPKELLGDVLVYNITQGVNREHIFKTNLEKKKYIELLRKYAKEVDIVIVAYCIMDNYAQILTYMESSSKISLFMKLVNEHYATYYNKINNRVGHVFRNKFCSKQIISKNYLYQCIKYIHMNPVKEKITKSEDEYGFSSYKEYMNEGKLEKRKIFTTIFNSEENYIEKLKITEYKEFNIDKANLKEEFNKFAKENKISLINKQNSVIIKKFISYLISKKYNFSKTEIAKLFNISRSQLYRYLYSKK